MLVLGARSSLALLLLAHEPFSLSFFFRAWVGCTTGDDKNPKNTGILVLLLTEQKIAKTSR